MTKAMRWLLPPLACVRGITLFPPVLKLVAGATAPQVALPFSGRS